MRERAFAADRAGLMPARAVEVDVTHHDLEVELPAPGKVMRVAALEPALEPAAVRAQQFDLAARELRALETLLLPALRTYLGRATPGAEGKQVEHQVHHMLMVVRQRLRRLEELAGSRSKRVVELRRALAAVERQVEAARVPARSGAAGDVAAQGVAAAAAPLPFASQIQRAFGRHDVSGIRVEIGGAAADAAASLGARAYATGDTIGFAAPPDLHTAAHEAAHVIQQRAGHGPAGGVDQPGDALEQHADQIADAVVHGISAEAMLDELVASRGNATVAVQRKAVTAASPAAAAPRTPANGKYEIDDSAWSVRVVRAWLIQAPAAHYLEVLRAQQHAGAFGWATEDGLRRVVERTSAPTRSGAPVISLRIDLAAVALMGLPPLSSAMVQPSHAGLEVAMRIDGVAPTNTRVTLGQADRAALTRAVEQFTGLRAERPLDAPGIAAAAGTIFIALTEAQLVAAFGKHAWQARAQHAGDAHAGDARVRQTDAAPVSVAHELTAEEHARARRFLETIAVPGAGPATRIDRSMLEMIDDLERQPVLAQAVAAQLGRVHARAPRAVDASTLREALEHARFEAERARFGLDQRVKPDAVDPSARVDLPARLVQHGLVVANQPARLAVVFDWAHASGAKADEARTAMGWKNWPVEIEWVFDRVDGWGAAAETVRSTHSPINASIQRRFRLPAGQHRGAWMVHAFVRSPMFAPKHLTLAIEAKSEQQRMAELRAEALGDMVPEDGWTAAPHRFDLGLRHSVVKAVRVDGRDYDATGVVREGVMPATFVARTAAERATRRQLEIVRALALHGYLLQQQARGSRGLDDSIAAAARRLAYLQQADREIAGDEQAGWQPFDVRAAYVSRTADAPSGVLQVVGGVKWSTLPGGGMDLVEVQLRDSSALVGAEHHRYTGLGPTFRAALETAFVDLCKDYPEGKVDLTAQDMDPRAARTRGGARATGKALGFELVTTAPWKRLRAKLDSPATQWAMNLAASVLMLFPPTAAFAVPFFIAQSTITNFDDLYTRASNGTLTPTRMAISLSSVVLDLMPATRIGSGLRGFYAVNFLGEVALVAAQVHDQLREMQAVELVQMTAAYTQLLALEHSTNASDPRLVDQRAAITRHAARISGSLKDLVEGAVSQRALFMINAGTFHRLMTVGRGGRGGDLANDVATRLVRPDATVAGAGSGSGSGSTPRPPARTSTPGDAPPAPRKPHASANKPEAPATTTTTKTDTNATKDPTTTTTTDADAPTPRLPAEQQAFLDAHAPAPAGTRRPGEDRADGTRIAGAVAGVTYAGGDRYQVTTSTGELPVEVRRTAGDRARIQRGDAHAVIEIPSALSGTAYERALAGKLTELRHLELQRDPTDVPSDLGPRGRGQRLSPDDHGRIAELRLAQQQLADAKARGASSHDVAELRAARDGLRRVLGLEGTSPAAVARRHAVDKQLAAQHAAAAPPQGTSSRPSQIGGERRANQGEQALIDAAIADRAGGTPARGEPQVSDAFRTDAQADHARWQTKGLQEDPRGRALLADPEFRSWYERWMSLPDNVTEVGGQLHLKLPHGIPDAIAAKLRRIVEIGNIGLMTRAEAMSRRIADAVPGRRLDPTAPDWQDTRARLVKAVGAEAVEKFEIEKTERQGERQGARAAVDRWIDAEIHEDEIDSLRRRYPGAEIYVTGSLAQPSKANTRAPQKLGDVDLIVVVQDSTPPNIRIEMESRLTGMQLDRPKGKEKAARPPLEVDGKVMTQSEFAGYAMMRTPEGRTPLANARLDAATSDAVPGTGRSGVDLHNHIMGVHDTAYYVDRIGRGSAIDVLDKAWVLVQSHGHELQPTTKAAIASAIADVRNGERAGLPRQALETRARRGLDQALSSQPHDMPFDHTYDLRDLFAQHHIDPASAENPHGRYENTATDALTTLHDQGVTASEQSISIKKLHQRFDEETMRKAHARAVALGKDSELAFLAMLPSAKTLSAGPGESKLPPALRDQVVAILRRRDVKGIDFAGPEAQVFTTPDGMAQLKEVYHLVAEAARLRNEPLVIRPHVGEGYDPHGTGAHAKVARRNLHVLLQTLDEVGYKPGGAVIVRLGHATHATNAQLQHMARLGVIVEANIGSNLATSSILHADQHPVLKNLYFGVPTVLATDGQGVMGTTLRIEYQRAAELIERFRRGEVKLHVDSRTRTFSELSKTQQARFSVTWLEQQVASYMKTSTTKLSQEVP